MHPRYRTKASTIASRIPVTIPAPRVVELDVQPPVPPPPPPSPTGVPSETLMKKPGRVVCRRRRERGRTRTRTRIPLGGIQSQKIIKRRRRVPKATTQAGVRMRQAAVSSHGTGNFLQGRNLTCDGDSGEETDTISDGIRSGNGFACDFGRLAINEFQVLPFEQRKEESLEEIEAAGRRWFRKEVLEDMEKSGSGLKNVRDLSDRSSYDIIGRRVIHEPGMEPQVQYCVQWKNDEKDEGVGEDEDDDDYLEFEDHTDFHLRQGVRLPDPNNNFPAAVAPETSAASATTTSGSSRNRNLRSNVNVTVAKDEDDIETESTSSTEPEMMMVDMDLTDDGVEVITLD